MYIYMQSPPPVRGHVFPSPTNVSGFKSTPESGAPKSAMKK